MYLGIIVDQHSRWEQHINYIIRKLQFILYKFKYLQNILNIQLNENHLALFARNPFELWHIRLGGVAKTHLNTLELLQKRFLRIMLHKDKSLS